MSLDPDEMYFWRKANMGTVRDLLPSELTPRAMLGGGRDLFKDLPACFWEAVLETFQWPWEPVSFVTLSLLDSLRPDRAKGEEAAVRYLNSKEPTVVPVKMSMGLPLAIIMVIVIGLGVMAWARV